MCFLFILLDFEGQDCNLSSQILQTEQIFIV